MSEITDKICSRGHWQVSIRPEPFNPERLDYAKLLDILGGVAVRLRGGQCLSLTTESSHCMARTG
jgi:hypothetical protein